jgi:hypothetical protein
MSAGFISRFLTGEYLLNRYNPEVLALIMYQRRVKIILRYPATPFTTVLAINPSDKTLAAYS